MDIRILSLQIDTKSKWGPHVKKIQAKISTQKLALSKLTTSTWEVTLAKSKIFYSSIIRLAITYASTIWPGPKRIHPHVKEVDIKLNIIQNNCLRIITEIYKIFPIKVLKTESRTEPISLQMDNLQGRARFRSSNGGIKDQIIEFRKKISQKIQRKER